MFREAVFRQRNVGESHAFQPIGFVGVDGGLFGGGWVLVVGWSEGGLVARGVAAEAVGGHEGRRCQAPSTAPPRDRPGWQISLLCLLNLSTV